MGADDGINDGIEVFGVYLLLRAADLIGIGGHDPVQDIHAAGKLLINDLHALYGGQPVADDILQGFLQLGLAVSPFILLFPIYKINKFLGFSQQLSLILPYIATSISFNTLLFTAYLRTVPKELDEAALMDGVSLWQLMTKILVPIAKPVLATVIIFNLLYIWNEYPFASIMIEKPAYYTISRGIAAFQGQYNIDYGGLAAYSVMVLLPELVFYGIFQRHVVDGMTVGAVKG